jgi:26S proteasome regulatory subunit T6
MVNVMKLEKDKKEKYDEIGGLDKKIKEIKEYVEINIKNKEYYEEMGIKKKKGVIIYGKKGNGKNLMDKEVDKKK